MNFLDTAPRLRLAHLPTPIERHPALDELLGVRLTVKRDDMTGGVEAGNKIRKLEFLLADAKKKGATYVLTCGAAQSNHARATAVLGARLGLRVVLFLRVPDPKNPPPDRGNLFIDRLVGAHVGFVSPEEYANRAAIMASAASALEDEGERAYVIPEGGSNGRGSLGYVAAMREIERQRRAGLGDHEAPFDVVTFACGSGGTAAGVAFGNALFPVAKEVRAAIVCDDVGYFARVTAKILEELYAIAGDEGRKLDPKSFGGDRRLVFDAAAKGPSYGVMTSEQRRFVRDVARTSGLVTDPVYTGKALFGVAEPVKRGEIARGSRVLFLHTGWLPGLLSEDPTGFEVS